MVIFLQPLKFLSSARVAWASQGESKLGRFSIPLKFQQLRRCLTQQSRSVLVLSFSLLLRFTDDTFDPDIGATIGKLLRFTFHQLSFFPLQFISITVSATVFLWIAFVLKFCLLLSTRS